MSGNRECLTAGPGTFMIEGEVYRQPEELDLTNLPPRVEFRLKCGAWVPYWKAEATRAMDGLKPRIEQAVASGGEINRQSITEEILGEVSIYTQEAANSVNTLRRVASTDDENQPDIELLRADPRQFMILAHFQLAEESLEDFSWHRRSEEDTQGRLLDLYHLTQELGDGYLTHLWLRAKISNQARLRFWNDQITSLGMSEE